MSLRPALLCLASMLCACPAMCADGPAPPLAAERTISHPEGITEVRFENGLRLLHRQNRTTDVVASFVFVRVGSIYEGDMLGSGISHYFEHIIHGGSTATRTEAEGREILKDLGNNSNAYTTRDATVYFIVTDAAHFPRAAAFLGDSMANCLIAQEEFERERGVIVQEIRKNRDDPRRMSMQLLSETMFPGHPEGQPVIGHESLFVAVTREQLERFYRRFYVANNMTVVVVGNVSLREATQAVTGSFRDLRRGLLPPHLLPPVPRQLETRWTEMRTDRFRQTLLAIGHHAVSIDHPDMPALDVLASILGGGESSRLATALRAAGIVQSVTAYSHTPAYDAGTLAISATLDGERLGDALEKTLEIIAALKGQPVTSQEIRTAVRQRKAGMAFYNESAERQAQSIGWDDLTTGNPAFSTTYLDALETVTPEDVVRVAQHYLTDRNRTVAIIRPEDQETPADDAVPEAAATDSIALPVAMTLENGLRVLCQPDDSVRSCIILAAFPGGLIAEKAEENGVSQLMATMLLQGTAKRDRATFHGDLEALGAQISSISGNNSWYVSIRCLAEDAPAAAEALAECLLTPRMAEEDFTRERGLQLDAIRMRDDSWNAEADTFFRATFFAGHPYERPVDGVHASVAALTPAQVKAFHAATLGADAGVVSFFGRITPEEARLLAERHFASMPKKAVPVPEPAQPRTAAGLHAKPNTKNQAVLAWGFPGVSVGHADNAPLAVLDTLVSGWGYPSGALHETLRGEADLVYLIHAFHWAGIGTGSFRIITQTSAGNVPEVMRRIRAVMEETAKAPYPPESIEQAKNAILISMKIGMEDVASRAVSMTLNELLGLGFAYHLREEAAIRAVTPADVLRVAKALRRSEVVCATGPQEALDAARKAFGSADAPESPAPGTSPGKQP